MVLARQIAKARQNRRWVQMWKSSKRVRVFNLVENTEPNPHSPMRFIRRALILRVVSSIKRELDQRALAALVDVLDLDG